MFNTPTRNNRRPMLLSGTLAMLALLACNTTEQDPVVKDPMPITPSKRDMAQVRKAYEDKLGTEHPYVGAKELYCATNDFGYMIHQGLESSHGAISSHGSDLRIKVADLHRAVRDAGTCVDPGPIEHTVTVHFGLDLNYAFAAALQVQCLSYDPDSGRYQLESSDAYYSIEKEGKLKHHANGLSGWQARYGYLGTYAERVFIRHAPGGGWSLFNRILDKRSVTFPYEMELDSLIVQNRLDSTTGILRLVPVAIPLEREVLPSGGYNEQGYHHRVVWVPEGVVIDDVPYDELFKNKGADLGAACPPSCPTKGFRFDTLGVAPRAQCKPASE